MASRSCETLEETTQWIRDIVEFLNSTKWLDTHLVNFFKDTLWESLDPQWLQCLRSEPVENLVRIPSGFVSDHWPESLTEFVKAVTLLALPRRRESAATEVKLGNVVAQGMTAKKKHEVGVASGLVSSVANSVGALTVLDVGSGQGYLSQALCFELKHANVVAIEASSHHSEVTHKRATRITRHYHNHGPTFSIPKTVTCRVVSPEMLALLVSREPYPVILAGLHACGDLSVTMLKTFLDCQHVKALVTVGCCYNLLSDDYGFPLSHGLKSTGFSLGKSLRDLACQSAQRWECLQSDDAINNFELHAFRATFQMVLYKFYPQVVTAAIPSIGRQGKALHRLQKTESKADKCWLFTTYCRNGLSRLGLEVLPDVEFHKIWKDVEPYVDLVGPYWSLRAALGPLLETLILLDRLLFLKELGDCIEVRMLPIFDPELSPRNVAIIAKKID